MAGPDGKVGIRYQLLPDSLLQPGVLNFHHPLCFCVPSVPMQCMGTMGMSPKMGMAKNWKGLPLGFFGHNHIRKGLN